MIDGIIERKWDQNIIEENQTSKTLQGHYGKTRSLSQIKPIVDLKTNLADNYHFHKKTQVLPGNKVKIDDRYFIDVERKRLSTEGGKRRLGSIHHETRPSLSAKKIIFTRAKKSQPQNNFVKNFLGTMRDSYSDESKFQICNFNYIQGRKLENLKTVFSHDSFAYKRIK